MARLDVTEVKEKCERVMTPGNSSTEDSRIGKETTERISSEYKGTDIEIEGEHGAEEEETGRQLLYGKVVQVHIRLQSKVTRRTRMVQWEMSWI